MGRRGSCPISPGLEEYIHNLRHTTLHSIELEQIAQKALDRRDTSTAYAKKQNSAKMSQKTENDRLVVRDKYALQQAAEERVKKQELKKGLIMRFRVNVSNIAWLHLVNILFVLHYFSCQIGK